MLVLSWGREYNGKLHKLESVVECYYHKHKHFFRKFVSQKSPQILTFFCDLPEALLKGCRQNLDPLSGSLSFFQWKKKNLSYTQCVWYKPPLLSQFSFLPFSVQLKRRCTPVGSYVLGTNPAFRSQMPQNIGRVNDSFSWIITAHAASPSIFQRWSS